MLKDWWTNFLATSGGILIFMAVVIPVTIIGGFLGPVGCLLAFTFIGFYLYTKHHG